MRAVNEETVKLIKRWEALRLKPYLCPANVPTIGYGTIVYPDGRKVSVQDPPISEKDAEMFLMHDIEVAISAVEKAVKVELNDNQFGALVSLTYNIGVGAFQRSTMLKKLNAGDFAAAADNFGKWIHGGGKVLPGLVKRRDAERTLFLKSI